MGVHYGCSRWGGLQEIAKIARLGKLTLPISPESLRQGFLFFIFFFLISVGNQEQRLGLSVVSLSQDSER